MPNFAQLSIEFIILALRIAVIFLLYLFLYQVLRAITRELRTAGSEQSVASQYGHLVVVNAGQTGLTPGKRFPLNQVNTIGRAMTNDVALNDTFLSSEHALLQWDGKTWLLEDLESTNGTRLNGREVDQPAPLTYGDTIQLGHIDLKLSR
ncbi:MAG: FHA domain-containing protein [Herpetosiphonaceae bacterium]|nr:FHA domain-containing protein [Herpetosiphonaceae bacterium]